MPKFSFFENEDRVLEFNCEAIIFQEGTPGQAMYAVLEGEVELQLKGVTVNHVAQHEIFGEMALVDNSKRSATAQARTDCKLAVIDKERFEYLVQKRPDFATQVMQVLAERLRKTTLISIQDKIKRIDSNILDKLFLDDD